MPIDSAKLEHAACEVEARVGDLRAKRAFLGFDGFIDEVVHIVDWRTSATQYSPIRLMADYGRRLVDAAGKSTNIEMVTLQRKMGGNAPLMADALGRLGCPIDFVGALGDGAVDPLFAGLQAHGRVRTLCAPGLTIAAEFQDGKIMHGRLDSMNALGPEVLLAGVGGEEGLAEAFAGVDLAALLNWTMTPQATSIWRLCADVLAAMEPSQRPRHLFFDLCDPQKRPVEQLVEALRAMALFKEKAGCGVILGLNERESEFVAKALGIPLGGSDGDALIQRAAAIAEPLGGIEVVIHPTALAAAWSPDSTGWIDGPVCKAPVLTTGAGDHFNGGYCAARLMGMPPGNAVAIGVAVSGYYVRNAHGPAVEELPAFIRDWAAGRLE